MRSVERWLTFAFVCAVASLVLAYLSCMFGIISSPR
jgi:hypothetical protein